MTDRTRYSLGLVMVAAGVMLAVYGLVDPGLDLLHMAVAGVLLGTGSRWMSA